MARTRVINQSDGEYSFPAPYSGSIGPGHGAILDGTPQQVLANLGGAEAVGTGLRIESAGDLEPLSPHNTNPAASIDDPSESSIVTTPSGQLKVGVISDAQHGSRGGGTLHPDVVAAGASGFMSGADKTKLNGIAPGSGPTTPLSTATPADIGTAGAGSGTAASKDDHVHGHGNLAGGSFHAVATSGAAGFESAADKALFDLNNSAAQSLPTPGAVDVVHRTTRLTTAGAGADAATLANGTSVGQRKSVVLAVITVGGDSVVLTPTSFADGLTLTFAVLFDSAELEWNGAAWELVSKSGAVVA